MTDDDRKFLTEWGGGKWIEPYIKKEVNYGKCYPGQLVLVDDNRTFDNWTDFGWLISKLQEKDMCWELACDFTERPNVWNAPTSLVFEWLIKTPATRCQLICDFLREGRT